MNLRQLSDEELVERTPGRPEAFGEFYSRYEAAIVGFMLRRTGDRELAADLTAETFAAALVTVRRFRRERGTAEAWLYGIARNVLLRSARRRRVENRARRRLSMPPLALTDEMLERMTHIGDDRSVDRWLEQLTPDQATAIRSRVIAEEPYSQIAAQMRCSESVVRQRVSRGLAVLRELSKE